MSNINAPVVGPATTSRRGTMSAADKTKFDAITGAVTGGNTGDVTLAAVGSAPSANGATLAGQVLTLQPADATHPGVMTSGAQEFGGVKTLTGAILAGVTTITEAVVALVRAVGVSLVLRSSLGAGASDKCVVVGSSETDGGTHASAELVAVGTGVGGAFAKYFSVLKGRALVTTPDTTPTLGSVAALRINNTSATGQSIFDFQFSGVTKGGVRGDYVGNFNWHAVGYHQFYVGLDTSVPVLNFSGTGSVGRVGIGSTAGAAAAGARLVVFGYSTEDIQRWQEGAAVMARIAATGSVDQTGTDSSAAPGAATINKPTGKSAIASGATSVRITNNLVAAGDQVHATMQGDCGQRHWCEAGAGFFDLKLPAAASADTGFCWTVSKRI